jgi:hypothetical protein
MRDILGNKVYAKRFEEPIQTRIERIKPVNLQLENVPNLISASEKMRIANEKNNLPF